MKKVWLLTGMLVVASLSWGQLLPAPPAPDGTQSSDVITAQFAADATAPAKVVDGGFWRWNGLASAAGITDLALTAHCVSGSTCTELNPLYGPHPSVARLFGTGAPIMAAQFAVSYYLKTHNKNWKVPTAIRVAGHVYGIATGLAHF